MVKLNKIYTKTGDDGTTGLTDGSRVKKYDLRPEAYGTVDELNSILGMIVSLYKDKIRKEKSDDEILNLLKRIQNDLFDLGADLSRPFSTKNEINDLRIIKLQVEFLENFIDRYNKNLEPLNSFVLPGGTVISSWFHLARTVTRRAERNVCGLLDKEKINKYSLMYLNRLSDLLFVISRLMNDNGQKDVLWKPGQYQ
jgi:cob(I)alamin adenosyltransferase